MPIPIHERKVGDLRPNQVITTFGPGAIVDALKDSVIVLDIGYWGEKGKRIYDSRLASYFRVDGFFMPCTTASKGGIPAVMFPHMHICSECGYIFDARNYCLRSESDFNNYLKYGVVCPRCPAKPPAYPARFVIMCEDGHIHDFPWHQWVHKWEHVNCRDNLYINTSGNTSTLADIWVNCRDCRTSRNMSGALDKKNFRRMECPGRHPFRPNANSVNCSKPVIPSQRGASNVYFPVSRSAISIPPWINPLYNLIEEHLHDIEVLRRHNCESGVTEIFEEYFAERFSREEFDEALEKITSGVREFTEIKRMEYDAITHHADPAYASNKEHFKAEEEPLPEYLRPYFSRLIRITRLREVKVLLGFTRVDAPDPDADEEQPNIVYLDKSAHWLPAAEITGEGIFIEFNRNKLSQWLGKNDVKSLSKKYEDSYKEFCRSKNWRVNVARDATYVLMHTFAHLLIKQMAMFSGYSSSAIRERIYFGESMSGVLLYTGSTDQGGSLGGLVELGTVDKLVVLMRDMFQEALFCTNDPECLNNVPSDRDSNGAACHSCCMVSETACENGNRLLDRGLVVPLEKREDQAYFKELVMELCQLEM